MFDGDYFIHTWDVKFDIKDSCYTKFPFGLVQKWSDFEKIERYFAPKNMIVDEYNENAKAEFDKLALKHIDGHRRQSVYPMYYSIMKSIELVPPEYTHIIRCRFDTRVDCPITPKDGFWIPKDGDFYGINDQFAYGDAELMRHYAKTYLSIPTQVELNPEKILKYHMSSVKINRIPQKVWLARDYYQH
jgi:hypothetical protein